MPVDAKDIYVAQNSAGANTGADAADAFSVAWLNTQANWGIGANLIGPGTTVHLVGAISNCISILGSGSPGNPITIFFEPNANLTAPIWASSWSPNICAIFGGTCQNVTIDGGVNGLIQATQCGDNPSLYQYQTGCNGIVFYQGNNDTVKNLTIQNLFVRTAWSTNLSGSGTGVGFYLNNGNGPSFNCLVTNCVFHDMQTGVSFGYVAGCSNFEMSGCTAYNCNWGGNAGDASSTALLNGLVVRGNKFYNWQCWDDSGDFFHHNAFYGWAQSGGVLTNMVVSGNIVGPGFGGHNTAGLFVSGQVFGLLVNNNIFLGTDGTSPANGFVTIGINGGTANYGTYMVYNNTIIAAGNGTAISFGSGFGINQTCYFCTNNLIIGAGAAVFDSYYQNSSMLSDYDLFWNMAAPLNNPNPGQNSPFAVSGNGNAAYLNYSGPAPSWQAYGHDVHGVTSNPLLNANYVPQPGSGAITNGINLSAYFTTDFYGNPRPAGTSSWDIGAVQHAGAGPLPASNLHVINQ